MRKREIQAAGVSVVRGFFTIASAIPVLLGCGFSPTRAIDPTAEQRIRALEYAEAVAFSLGQQPSDSGTGDFFSRYSDSAAYGGHWIKESAFPNVELVVLSKGGVPLADLVERIEADVCVSPAVCAPTQLYPTRYSMAELRSVSGWVERSPLGELVRADTLLFEADGGWVGLIDLSGSTATIELLERMLQTAAVPADTYRLRARDDLYRN